MAGLQPYRFEAERFPNPEDSESENEEDISSYSYHQIGQNIVVELSCMILSGF